MAQVEAGAQRGGALRLVWLRVSASVGFGRRVLMPLVRRFVTARPAVKIDLTLSDLSQPDCIVYTELIARHAGGPVHHVLAALHVRRRAGARRGDVVRLLPDWSARPLPIHLLTIPERRGAAKVCASSEHVAQALEARRGRHRAAAGATAIGVSGRPETSRERNE